MDYPTFIITLLSGDWLFFNDDEIAWDGEHHVITGIQVNGAKVYEFMDFVESFASDFDDIQDVVNHFIGFLTEVEHDDGLKIPRSAIAPGVRKAIREGDLTGITLANLAACGSAFQVKLKSDNEYVMLFDTRLSAGIPSFFDLMARLLWDLRQCLISKRGVPFTVIFMGMRSVDADACLGDVSKFVIGAQESPGAMKVTECPAIGFSSDAMPDGGTEEADDEAEGTETCFAAFHSGFDEPMEMQADEELFEACALSLARGFPMTVKIEGTHVHGRADRIESVKVGDALTLAADWQTQFFNPVGIEVFNDKGESLGYVSEQLSPALSGNRELACLLPYLTATVESVTPLSQRRGNAKHALMDIRLEADDQLAEGVWLYLDSAVLEDMKSLLALPKPERVVLSRSALSASDLKGSIDVSQAKQGLYANSLAFLDAKRENADQAAEPSVDEAEEEGDGRDAMLSMLQLLVLAGSLSGTEFPAELLEKLERAKEGDLSIDLMELANELNNAAPSVETVDLSQVTFNEGSRVEGRQFSVAVPDGWTALKDYKEEVLFSEGVRPFVIVPFAADNDSDISLSDKVLYCSFDEEAAMNEVMQECGIPALKWAMHFYNAYYKGDELRDLKPNVLWDAEVESVNTTCFVTYSKQASGINGAQCFIYPYSLDGNDFIRCSLSIDEDDDAEAIKSFAVQLAESVQLNNPQQPLCERQLETALAQKMDPEEFSTMVLSFMKPFLAMAQSVFSAGQYKYFSSADDPSAQKVLIAGASALADYAEKAVPILASLVDAYEVQIRLGATEEERASMLEALEGFDQSVFPRPEMFGDGPEDAQTVGQSGVLDPSLDLQQVRARLHDLASGPASDEVAAESANTPDCWQEMAARASAEEYKMEALPSIVKAMTNRISAEEYVSISESIGFGTMQSRQRACNSATSSLSSDEDNVVAMSREFARFNPIIARYVGYMLDVIDAQAHLGADRTELRTMANEAEELMSLIADSFSCGNAHLDSVANRKAPVTLPDSYDDLKNRLAAIKEM